MAHDDRVYIRRHGDIGRPVQPAERDTAELVIELGRAYAL